MCVLLVEVDSAIKSFSVDDRGMMSSATTELKWTVAQRHVQACHGPRFSQTHARVADAVLRRWSQICWDTRSAKPRWSSSGAVRSFRAAFSGAVLWQRNALRTTITGEGGDDSQRVNRVIQASGAHCHFVVCACSPCPLNEEKSHPCPKNSLKKCNHIRCNKTPFLPYTSRRLRSSGWQES